MNVFRLWKINLKAVNAKGLAAPSGKALVIVVALVKCTVEAIVDVAEKTSRGRTV